MPDKMLTVTSVAERLGVHRNTVDKLIRDAQITAIRVRGAWRIKESDLDAYVKQNTRTAQTAQ